MKGLFREYYGLSPQELKIFFDNCLFVFDTNALLDLYRLDISDALEVVSIMENYKDRVVIPYHVAKEYHNELLNVISKSIQNANETLKYDYATAISTFLKNITSFQDLPFALQEKYKEKMDNIVEELKKDVEKRKSDLKTCMEGWELQFQIAKLLGNLLLNPLSKETIEEIIQIDGPKRYSESIPPGYKDYKKNNGNEYGDLIIWREILECVKHRKQSVAFISRDLKEDWIEKRNGIDCGPRRELRTEFYNVNKDGEFYIYTLTQFLRYAKDKAGVDDEKTRSLISSVEQLMDKDEDPEKNQNKCENELIKDTEKRSIDVDIKNDFFHEKLSN